MSDDQTNVAIDLHEAVKEPISTNPPDSPSSQPHVTPNHPSKDFQPIFTLLELEPQARAAQSIQELQFLAVNETRRLLPYRQGFLFTAGATPGKVCQLEAASSLPHIQHDAPLTQWLERTLHTLRQKDSSPSAQRFCVNDCPPELKSEWQEFSFAHVLWCPFILPNNTFIGGLWLAKETPWLDSEVTVAQRLCATYAHAWGALSGNKNGLRKRKFSTRWWWLGMIAAFVILSIPVRMSTLAPMEIVAKDPAIVSAPMDGIIANILEPPNTFVSEDQVLFRYEDTNFRNQYEIAQQNLSKVMAEYKKAVQGAFVQEESNATVLLLKTEVQLREAERDYALERLSQVEVKAKKDGVLLYSNKSDWIGRPISVGQRIMEIADPTQIEVKVDVPVDDAIIMKQQAAIEVFLDAKPLDKLTATLTQASYHATQLPEKILAYQVRGTLKHSPDDVRIGWRGTAKIYGEQVPMYFLLFRKPISATRQFLGV